MADKQLSNDSQRPGEEPSRAGKSWLDKVLESMDVAGDAIADFAKYVMSYSAKPSTGKSAEQKIEKSAIPIVEPEPHPNVQLEEQFNIESKAEARQAMQPAEGKANRPLVIIGAILLVCILVFGGMRLLSNMRAVSQANAKFDADYNAFILEGQKLSVLIEQGVTEQEYKSQLAEVKSRYGLIGDNWPSSYQDKRQSFDQAIEGWDLARELIDYKNSLHLSPDVFLLGRAASYIGVSRDKITNGQIELVAMKDLIGVVLGQASSYFDKGR